MANGVKGGMGEPSEISIPPSQRLRSGTWLPIDMEDGVSPWHLHQTPAILHTCSKNLAKYDYSASMDREKSHLRNVVYDILSRTYPGVLVRAEFRLCAAPPPPGPRNEAVHHIPQLEEGLLGPPVQLAKTLRPDQQAALRFVVDSESAGKTQRCLFRAFVRMRPPPLVVGGHARLNAGFCPNQLCSMVRLEFNKQSRDRMQQVLGAPGLVTSIDGPDWGDTAVVTVAWSFADGTSFSLFQPKSRLEAVSLPSARFFLGRLVRLRRSDELHRIGVEDVGFLTKYGADDSVEVSFPQCFRWQGRASDLALTSGDLKLRCAEVRVAVEYRLFGSICAQKMGWGKTPLMVALIKHKDLEAAAHQRRSTSLVIVPPKVHRQWVNELRAWLGAKPGTSWDDRLNEHTTAWMVSPCGILVWAPVDMRAFKATTPSAAARADVVVLPHSIFDSKKYPSASEKWPLEIFNVQSRTWSRLILDEAHELSGVHPNIQRRLLAVKRDAVHALSGTPEQGGGSRGAASLALTLKASLCPMSATPEWFCFDADEHVTLAASEFFGAFARSQASPLRLPVTEHIVPVQLSEAERVLYANLTEHGAPSTRAKLELCCCFVSETSSSATKEIGALIKQKQKELESRMCAAKGHAAFVVLLSRCVAERGRLDTRRQSLKSTDERKEIWDAGQRMLEPIFAGLDSLGYEELAALVKEEHVHGSNSQELMASVAPFAESLRRLHTGGHPHAAMKKVFNEQLDQLARNFVPLGGLKIPLDFLQLSMSELAGGGGCCPICLDGLENGEGTMMTSCGHAFHKDCINAALKSRGQCPSCRQQVKTVWATKPPTPVDPYLKYGTKVKVMIQQLTDIMRDYPGDRLLLFVQYKDMRKKLEQAFREFKVPFLTLSGSARMQGSAITRWQSGQDPEDFLMMLSCEEHNSGITLTRARPGVIVSVFAACEGLVLGHYPSLRLYLQAPHVSAPLRSAVTRGGQGHGESGSGTHQPNWSGSHFAGSVARRDGRHNRARIARGRGDAGDEAPQRHMRSEGHRGLAQRGCKPRRWGRMGLGSWPREATGARKLGPRGQQPPWQS